MAARAAGTAEAPGEEHGRAAPQIEQGHERNQAFAHPADAPHAPQNHRPAGQGHPEAHGQGVPAQGGPQRGGDGVGLNQVAPSQRGAHTAQGEQSGHAPPAQSTAI